MKVDVDMSGIKSKFSDQNMLMARRAVMNQFDISAQPFIPEQSSHLMSWRVMAIDGTSITYTVPYAHRQFTAPAGWKYTKAGSGPRWDKQVKARYMPELLKAFLLGGKFIG